MSKSNLVKETISNPEIHKGWEKSYRTEENEKFFELAFNDIAKNLNAPEGSLLLDAGCGSCRHSPRLAKHGFNIIAADYSDYIVSQAKETVSDKGLEKQIHVQREDLLKLSFEGEKFDYILCWGVLMHIPDIETAIAELSRVLKPGGTIVLSEVNMHSLEVFATERLRPLLGKKHIASVKTDAGIEIWAQTDHGRLLSRRLNIRWLENTFLKHKIHLVKRSPGQFTEAYTRVQNSIGHRLIHKFNNFWFKFIGLAGPACGNILYFKKQDEDK